MKRNKPATFPYAAKTNTSWLRSIEFGIAWTGFTSLETLKGTETKLNCFQWVIRITYLKILLNESLREMQKLYTKVTIILHACIL